MLLFLFFLEPIWGILMTFKPMDNIMMWGFAWLLVPQLFSFYFSLGFFFHFCLCLILLFLVFVSYCASDYAFCSILLVSISFVYQIAHGVCYGGVFFILFLFWFTFWLSFIYNWFMHWFAYGVFILHTWLCVLIQFSSVAHILGAHFAYFVHQLHMLVPLYAI